MVKQQINQDQTELQTRNKILWTFQSFLSNKKTSLQVRAIKKIEDPQCFSYITARIGHHKEKPSANSFRTRQEQQ